MKDNRMVFSRAQIGQVSSFVGGLALLLTLILLLWQGGLTTLAWITLIIGVGGIGLWIALAPRDFIAWVQGRQARYGTGSILATLLFIGLVALLYGWAAGQRIAVDMTAPQTYTLGPQSQDILAQLNRPVRLTGFYSSATLPQRELDDVIYHLYETTAPERFSVEYVDPTVDTLTAQRFGVDGDGVAYLTFVDPQTGEPDLRLIEQVGSGGAASERDIGNALLRLLASGQFKLYFVTGHGEIDTMTTEPDSISGAFLGPNTQGILTDVLNLGDVLDSGIPSDATALVIAGARRRFSPAETTLIANYLDRGGSLFIAADVLLDPQDTFLDAEDPLRDLLEARFAAVVNDDLIVDEGHRFDSRFSVIATTLERHIITQNVIDSGLDVVFFQARSLTPIFYGEEAETAANVGRAPIVFTSPDAFAETDLESVWEGSAPVRDGNDPSGVLTMALVAQDTESGARLFLVGDADWMRNSRVVERGNSLFYTGAIDWLLNFSAQLEVQPINNPYILPVSLTPEGLSTIFIITVIVLPGAVLVVGLLVWNFRRGR